MGTAARKCTRGSRQWLKPAHFIGLAGDSAWLSTHLLVVIALEPVTGLEDNLLFCVRLRWLYTQLFYEWNSEANKDLERTWLT